LNVLTDAALNDPNGHVKEKAFATIQQLANHETAEAMVQNPALILALKDALLSNTSMDAQENNTSLSREYASSTLTVLERSITPDNPSHYQALRELLNSLSPSVENDD
jgi:formate dehydrogenase maturation protein FdhE